MDDPWNEQSGHPIFYCLLIVICTAILLAILLPPLLGVTP